MGNQIYISQLSTSLCFYKLLFEVKKIDVRLNKTLKLKFILMFFDSVYPTRPSDTVTKYTIQPPILLVERLFKWFWVLFCNFILWVAKPGSKMPCILHFEIEYLLKFVSTNSHFCSHPSDTKIQTAIIWCQLQQKSQEFANLLLWTSFFRYANLKIVSLITSESFNRNLSIVHPILFFNFVIAPN